MRLYDEIIHDILTSLEKQDKHILPVGAAADPVSRDWQDAGKAMMILQPDMAYELGGHNLPAVGNTLVTTGKDFVPEDEIILIGKDLPEITEDIIDECLDEIPIEVDREYIRTFILCGQDRVRDIIEMDGELSEDEEPDMGLTL